MTIIGLSGKAGSGKDTIADYLVEHHNFTKLAFAGVLKQSMKILFDLSDQQLNDSKQKETIDPRWNKTPRQLMQWLGTDILKYKIRHDFFIIHVKNKISKCKGNIVISDVRFADEASSLKELGATIISIDRPGHKGTLNSSHASEQFEFKPDHLILNNSSKKELFKKILKFI